MGRQVVKLILFDIDGTLLSAGGAGTRSLTLAFRDLFSIVDAFRDISMAGKTDIQIIKEGLSAHDIRSSNGLVPAVIDSYLGHLGREMDNDRKHLKPGIREVLLSLSEIPSLYALGLLTGNLEKGARIKLESFGLNGYFPSGAFGSDNEDRNMLLPVAVQRFGEILGTGIRYGDCIIVGDTPRDVACAKPYGAVCIGVATGPYPFEALVEAGADVVLKDLSDTGVFLEAVRA